MSLCHLPFLRCPIWQSTAGYAAGSMISYPSLSMTRREQDQRGETRANETGCQPAVRKPNRLLAAAELDAQHVHMMSFVQALRLASRRDWHAKLWRELYNCGEDMAPKLRQSPNFRVWVAGFQDGKDFARAIGIRDM